MSHDIWLFDVEKEAFMLELPSNFDNIEESLSASLNMLQEMIQDTSANDDFHLFMENRYFKYKGIDEKGILVFASEFRVGIIVMNAEMQNSHRIGPYSTKQKKLYKSMYKKTPEC